MRERYRKHLGSKTGKTPSSQLERRIAGLAFWDAPVTLTPITGGMTNSTWLAQSGNSHYVVRVGGDFPEHHIMRFNERAASRAAWAAGLSPALLYDKDDISIFAHVRGRPLTAADFRKDTIRAEVLRLLQRCHGEVAKHLRGPSLMFRVFALLRDYAHLLRERESRRRVLLNGLMDMARQLEGEVGPYRPVFGHNDLLPANFIHDGERLWLIDWDYGGFTHPLFDLANLSVHAELTAEEDRALLVGYFGERKSDNLSCRFQAFKCAALLREAMWGMVMETEQAPPVDGTDYADRHLARLEHVWRDHLCQDTKLA